MEHDPQECRNHLNCVNECIPCEVSGCAECSTNAAKCDVCQGDLVLSSNSCQEGSGPKHVGAGKEKAEKKGKMEEVAQGVAGGVSDTAGSAAGSLEDAGGSGVDAASNQLDNMDPVEKASKVSQEVQEGEFENIHVLLSPTSSVSGAMAAGGIIGYIVLVCCCGFCYLRIKGDMLNDWGSNRLPTDGFSDNIWACKTDSKNLSICCWSCFCPCIRWADTISEMGYLRFPVALAIWIFLCVGNSFLMGLGSLILIGLGAYFRIKLRASWGLQSNTAMDIFNWCCCIPCVVAQEARHVERARSLKIKDHR